MAEGDPVVHVFWGDRSRTIAFKFLQQFGESEGDWKLIDFSRAAFVRTSVPPEAIERKLSSLYPNEGIVTPFARIIEFTSDVEHRTDADQRAWLTIHGVPRYRPGEGSPWSRE